MKFAALLLLSAALIAQSGCSQKEPAPEETPAASPSPSKGPVSVDAPADAPPPADQAAPPPAANDAPPPEAPPEAPGVETIEGESELSNWNQTLAHFAYTKKRMPKDINELAASVGKPAPRPPAGYRIVIENQRVVLKK